jgi:uncharacterized protein YjiS (DUF1127 family)
MILSHVIRALRVWRRYRTCVRELSELSDIELADIGLTRSGIPGVAWHVSRQDGAGETSAQVSRSDDR